MTERVFVVPRDILHSEPWPQGFVPLDDKAATAWLHKAQRMGFFAPRPQAEAEPAWKQPIPYCALVRRSAPEAPPELFVVERLKAGGEARLHGKLSVGIGGHIGPGDTPFTNDTPSSDLFTTALHRELGEELDMGTHPKAEQPRLVGLINDDSNPVGRVHVGLAYLLELPATTPYQSTFEPNRGP